VLTLLDILHRMPALRQPEVSPLAVRRLDLLPDPELAFVHIYGESPSAFWLDSSAAGERSRFSFMGDSQGPLAAVVAYDASAGEVTIRSGDQLETRAE
jgi:para-aminobenzoate synthetase